MLARAAATLSREDVSLIADMMLRLVRSKASWTGEGVLWAAGFDDLMAMGNEIVQSNELVLGLLGWPTVV